MDHTSVRNLWLVGLVLLIGVRAAQANGFAHDANFIVQAPDQQLAEEVLAAANRHRTELANHWLGKALAEGEGRTLVTIEVQDQLRGRFNAKQSGDVMHTLWLVGPREEVQGAWLARHVAQVVIATRHPGRLAPWQLEGVAAQHDNAGLQRQRRQMLKWFSRSGRWPSLAKMTGEDVLISADRAALVAAASLVEFLVAEHGAPAALDLLIADRQFQGDEQLQANWQRWAQRQVHDIRADASDHGPARYIEWDHNAATARSENFTIYAANREYAKLLLSQAEQLREEIAIEWLGEPLPPGVGRTTISVRIEEDVDQANTLITDPAKRVSQMMWIRTAPEAVYSAMAHEISHTVLATQFAYELPAWAHEGIASQRDDPRRQAIMAGQLAEMARSGRWLRLEALLTAQALSHSDSRAYASANSLTQYLTTLGDHATFVAFAVEGHKSGWDAALRKHYGMENVRQLQANWQWWVGVGAAEVGSRSRPARSLVR